LKDETAVEELINKTSSVEKVVDLISQSLPQGKKKNQAKKKVKKK